jgi:hypothetical protein
MEAANVTVTAAKKEAVSVPRAPVACQCPRREEGEWKAHADSSTV